MKLPFSLHKALSRYAMLPGSFVEKSVNLFLSKNDHPDNYDEESFHGDFGEFVMGLISRAENSCLDGDFYFPNEIFDYIHSTDIPSDLSFTLTKNMYFFWCLSKQLQTKFPIKSLPERRAYALWFVNQGLLELKLSCYATYWQRKFLISPPSFIPNSEDLYLSNFTFFLWETRKDLFSKFDVYNAIGAIDYFKWYCVYGTNEYNCYSMFSSQQLTIANSLTTIELARKHITVPMIVKWIVDCRDDIKGLVLGNGQDLNVSLASWINSYGYKEYPCLHQFNISLNP